MLMNDILLTRAKSSIGVSLPTDLALESLFEGKNSYYDPERKIPNDVDIKKYSVFLINVETLLRNMFSSIPSSERTRVGYNESLYCILQELDFIKGYVDVHSNESCKLIPYRFDAKLDTDKRFKNAQYRKSVSETSQFMDHLIETVGISLARQRDTEVTSFSSSIRLPNPKKTLILTHSVIDLVAFSRYEHLDLLESNTGVLKDRGLFHTKLFNGKSLTNMPLNTLTLQVFGDNHKFRPQSFVARDEVIRVAAKRNWRSMTTDDKVRGDISALVNGETRDLLMSMI